MADRYWVGGTGAWDSVADIKWAATSGGVGGLPVPTSDDDVFFDAASGAVMISNTEAVNCRNLNFTGFTGTFTGSNGTLNIFGNLTAVAGMTWSHTGTLVFSGSGVATLTSGGKSLGPITISKTPTINDSVTLQDALTSISTITVNTGTFNTDVYNLTATSISSNNSNIRAINLGSSTVTLSTTTPLVFTTSTNLTFNAGTSTIILPANITTFNPTNSNLTLYNLTFTNTTVATRTFSYTGNYTYNRLTVAGPASTGVMQVVFIGSNTFNDGLATSGTAGNRRVWFRSETVAIARTLTVNGAGSLTDADFSDIYIIGTAAPISGTRIGNLRGCDGITFSTPKTVYCVSTTSAVWSALTWSNTVGGAASSDYFPLAQDTATFVNTGLSNGATITWDTPIPYTGTIDMSARTLGMTMNTSTTTITVYGDWKNGSGTLTNGSGGIVFSGRNTQTITSSGKTFVPGITINSYSGTVQLADAINVGYVTVTNGTFATNGYAVSTGSLSSSSSNVRTIDLGASTVTLTSSSGLSFSATNNPSVNLNFIAGTSTIICTTHSTGTLFGGGGMVFYNVSFSATSPLSVSFAAAILGDNTYNNLSITGPSSSGIIRYSFSGNSTITGTFTCTGGSAVRRIFLQSNTFGTTRTFTANSLSATDCDFQDIKIAGVASGSSTTRTGDCGGNSGIAFPAPKTVYWNLAGIQNWNATAWATSSGGTPNIDNFPLAQDTAVFDNSGAVGTVATVAEHNIGSVNMSARTTTMTFNVNSCTVYGNFTLGAGVTFPSTTNTLTFSGRGTQTITSNGVSFGPNLTINSITGVVELADALTMTGTNTLTFSSGTFNAVAYNVTVNKVFFGGSTLRMGSGTWTLTGFGTVWNYSAGNLITGSSNIVLSNTSTSARTFAGGGKYYNKITIGGTTGVSTTTFTGNNTIGELASIKTVAHTIALGSTSQTFGKWTITGTAGNVVTVTGTGTNHVIYGSRVSGVNYLAMGSIGFAATSSAEFYAGPNSTGTNATIIKTAAPAPVTRYWVGGTGTWDATTTTKWSNTSGGAGGFSVPTSADTVIFDAGSSASAYTVTCTATQLRCGSLNISGPASGNVTWAGTAPLAIHGNITLATTGVARSYSGSITLSGSTTNKVITTNGITLQSAITINCDNCTWSLGSALTNNSSITVTIGSFDLVSYSVFATLLSSNNTNTRSINLGSSTISLQNNVPINFGVNEETRSNLTFNSGTSQIGLEGTSVSFFGNNQTFYNVAFNRQAADSINLNGINTFNDLYISNVITTGVKTFTLTDNQTVNGTMTIPAGAIAGARTFIRSSVIGTARTITCSAFSGADVDFCDIIIDGAAAPISGTRLGDCKGNSGITFTTPKTVYWSTLTGNSNFYSNGWALTSGGIPSYDNFPLAQDTIVFTANFPNSGTQITIGASYNIGTIDTSDRTSNTLTLFNTADLYIYGDFINGTGLLFGGSSSTLHFRGRNSQNITSAGRTFSQPINIYSPGGSVTLQDAITISRGTTPDIWVNQGTFDANGYNVTTAGSFGSNGLLPRTVAVGSGTWLIGGSGWDAATATNLTVTGSGTISITSSSVKAFAGGGANYSGITVNQGGSSTLTFTGNNTFKDITNTYSATGATSIAFGSTTQTLQQFTASGGLGRLLTLSGTSAASPANLVLTGSSDTTSEYVNVSNVRMYKKGTGEWKLTNSNNLGSFGAVFLVVVVLYTALGNFFSFF